jgi:CobQ/CobB/MinD/ParA nucleotide binding domain
MRFSDALPKAQALIEAEPEFRGDVTLVRDVYGRIRIALPVRPQPFPRTFAQRFHEALGAFSPGQKQLFLFKQDMFAPEILFDSPDRLPLPARAGLTLYLLDRQVTGQDWLQDWLREPLATRRPEAPQRVTFFGLKGGVGRSTALAVLAWRLARAGRRVLVVDLDLESPGLGSVLLPRVRLPDFGVIDWFVEDAVGQADQALVADMIARSPLIGDADPGEILVVPAAAKDEQDYLAKLSRAYLEVKGAGGMLHFGKRLQRMLQALEARHAPDVVLLDSRAGMHDIAAVAVTRLDALAFLFAVDGAYTWDGYRLLFQHWRRDARLLRGFRKNLRMVAGLAPETGRPDYFASFRRQAWDLFTDYIYEATGGEEAESEDPFSFDLDSDSAPHDFLHVNWNRAFFAFDPVRHPEAIDDGLLRGGFGDFVERAAAIILGEPQPWA